MNLLAPLWLAAAGLAAAVVVGLHLLARRRPRLLLFPTARFIPDRPASAAAPATRPSDLVVLLLRVLAILSVGLAFAGPYRSPPDRVANLVLIDRSRAAPTALDPETLRALRGADLVLRFDSVVGAIKEEDWSTGSLPTSNARGSLSVALVAALRAAPALAERGDSVAIMIVSPLVAEEWDESTLPIRRLWPGGIQVLVQHPATRIATSTAPSRVEANDPLGASLVLVGDRALAMARVLRTQPTGGDSIWARSGGTLVYWPRDPGGTGWQVESGDTVTGVLAGGIAVVAPFYRSALPPPGEVVSRWLDGKPAATQERLGAGCLRSVGIPISQVGDFAVRSSVVALVKKLIEPCDGLGSSPAVPAVRLDSLRGRRVTAASRHFPRTLDAQVPANGWFLVSTALLLLIELVIRRSRPRS